MSRRRVATSRFIQFLCVPNFSWMLDAAPLAARYFSDGFHTYFDLLYWGAHEVALGKSEIYSVEGSNADLWHYLARLARSPRCFSCCIHVLRRVFELFLQLYNRRQSCKHARLPYPAHIKERLLVRV